MVRAAGCAKARGKAKPKRQPIRSAAKPLSKAEKGRLRTAYYDVGKAGSYSGVKAFRKHSKAAKALPQRLVKRWLLGEQAYTKHVPIRRKFPRSRIVVHGVDEHWQADLVDLQSLAS